MDFYAEMMWTNDEGAHLVHVMSSRASAGGLSETSFAQTLQEDNPC